jgi:hypothetical protein
MKKAPIGAFFLCVKPCLSGKQILFFFNSIGILHAAVYRAYRRTLWFFMKALTLGTLIGHNEVDIIIHRALTGIGIHHVAVFEFIQTLDCGSFGYRPFYPAFVYGIVWAFWLTGTTVYTVIGNYDRHNLYFFNEHPKIGVEFILINS